ncbi:hypothetical protein [Bythopirellula polymerisocia]|uniref:PEP-CTERM protein-sorting domain-containing protein n=1 Tax=Bythopirellula polymerisocia TaxID=2528003 RepID=A0A5C6D0W0_9BACT|nr:hypothetical protein [Bythopirellula polymerisocia]TWU29815.1 hypothetical protein Pla144_05940 [Bythopirellula polymerisocia]
MNREFTLLSLLALVVLFSEQFAFTQQARGHEGRRFLIEVVNGKLQVQGINSGMSDGAPATRPYTNSIHDHWKNYTSVELGDIATSFLPDFEIQIGTAFVTLKDHEVVLELLSVKQWLNPPLMPAPETIPNLQPLDPGEVIRIEAGTTVTSDTLGSLLISPSVPQTGIADILVNYSIDGHPSNEIHVLQFRLSATPADPNQPDLINDSDPIYILLSPDGDNPMEKLHHASLYLEQYLATVPEPGSFALATMAAALLVGIRRSKRLH